MVDQYDRLPSAPDRHEVKASKSGYVSALRAEHVGRAAVTLGAGRSKLDDQIDPGVGIEIMVQAGGEVRNGDTILRVHHRDGRGLEDALALLAEAVHVSEEPPAPRPIVIESVGASSRGNS